MARFTLCFILLAAALSHAVQPPDAADRSVVSSNLAGLNSAMATAIGPRPLVANE